MFSISNKKSFRILLLIILVIIVSLIGYISKIQQIDPQQKIKNILRDSFQGSYRETLESSGNVVEFNLTAQEAEISLVEDAKTKVWSYNESVPGPEIRVNIGDTVKVTLQNNLPVETTIHWHGVRVPNLMDGVPGVTQDPIAIGESFTYEFVPKDAGTFWFHPHVRAAEQVERGLYGTLIIVDPDDPQYDMDKTLVVDDWRLTNKNQVNPYFVTGHDLAHDGRWGSHITVNGRNDETLTAKSGSVNRLRFVNTSNARVYKLDFGSLNAIGIAVDGMKSSAEFNPQGFELSPGNRIDVLVTIPSDSENVSYFIRDVFTRNISTLVTINIEGSVNKVLKESIQFSHVPDWSQAKDLEPDVEYILNAQRSSGMGIEWTINGKAYPDFDLITLKHNTFNKVRFRNDSSRLHPMHLHGQFFQVIARNGIAVNEPYWRDTVLIHGKETVDIALVPLDKGKWVNHCHILEHAESGMLTVVEVK